MEKMNRKVLEELLERYNKDFVLFYSCGLTTAETKVSELKNLISDYLSIAICESRHVDNYQPSPPQE